MRVDETPIDARDEVVGDDEFDDRMERLFARNNHDVEFLGLWNCAWEALYECASGRRWMRLTRGEGGVG
jgi:hypothetical protein